MKVIQDMISEIMMKNFISNKRELDVLCQEFKDKLSLIATAPEVNNKDLIREEFKKWLMGLNNR